MIVLILLCTAVAAAYLYFKLRYTHFARANIHHLPPTVPFGNLTRQFFQLEHTTDVLNRVYYAFPEDRFVGHYEFSTPIVILRDLNLIKDVCIKYFDFFTDHRIAFDENTDSLFGKNLISLKGKVWRDMRGTLSPAFTSSKIRLMVPLMTKVANQMNNYLREKIVASGDKGSLEVDVWDLTSRCASDIIATCAFGVQSNSHADRENTFFVNGRATHSFSLWQKFKFSGFTQFPAIMNFFKASIFTQATKDYYRGLVGGMMRDRQERNIIRDDMIHLLTQAKRGHLTHEEKNEDAGFATVQESDVGLKKSTRAWSDDYLVAQAILFFLAGFDTMSTVLSFLMHELALHPDVQDRLLAEIRENEARDHGKFDFNSIQQMTYMDMVVSELLRLWVPTVALDRVAVKDFNIGKPNSNSTEDYIIRKGDVVWLPVWAIHHNPEYYPEPFKFDPERFSKENRHLIRPYTYLPFGTGPRNCIGSRFALCVVKLMVYHMLKEVELAVGEKTCVPLRLALDNPRTKIGGQGAWLRVKLRQ